MPGYATLDETTNFPSCTTASSAGANATCTAPDEARVVMYVADASVVFVRANLVC